MQMGAVITDSLQAAESSLLASLGQQEGVPDDDPAAGRGSRHNWQIPAWIVQRARRQGSERRRRRSPCQVQLHGRRRSRKRRLGDEGGESPARGEFTCRGWKGSEQHTAAGGYGTVLVKQRSVVLQPAVEAAMPGLTRHDMQACVADISDQSGSRGWGTNPGGRGWEQLGWAAGYCRGCCPGGKLCDCQTSQRTEYLLHTQQDTLLAQNIGPCLCCRAAKINRKHGRAGGRHANKSRIPTTLQAAARPSAVAKLREQCVADEKLAAGALARLLAHATAAAFQSLSGVLAASAWAVARVAAVRMLAQPLGCWLAQFGAGTVPGSVGASASGASAGGGLSEGTCVVSVPAKANAAHCGLELQDDPQQPDIHLNCPVQCCEEVAPLVMSLYSAAAQHRVRHSPSRERLGEQGMGSWPLLR